MNTITNLAIKSITSYLLQHGQQILDCQQPAPLTIVWEIFQLRICQESTQHLFVHQPVEFCLSRLKKFPDFLLGPELQPHRNGLWTSCTRRRTSACHAFSSLHDFFAVVPQNRRKPPEVPVGDRHCRITMFQGKCRQLRLELSKRLPHQQTSTALARSGLEHCFQYRAENEW